MSEIEYDIVNIIDEYLEHDGSTEKNTIMLLARMKIERLRESYQFALDENNRNNRSRLKLLDVISNCRELFEETLQKGHACELCKWREEGEKRSEHCHLNGLGCFELDYNLFNKIVYKTQGKE